MLTYLKNWDKLFESPFKSDVYFFSTATGHTVRDAAQLHAGDEIVTTFANGTARSRVEETRS